MRDVWDRRYRLLGASLRASMFKGLPDILNDYLHQWQLRQLVRIGAQAAPARCLDAGCGYGRLALPLANRYPRASVIGLDGSIVSIRLFEEQLRRAGTGCVGDIASLPFADASFDLVIMVTALMYLPDASRQLAALRELVRILHPEGRGVVIENHRVGGWISDGVRRLGEYLHASGSAHVTIAATTFDGAELDRLLAQAGARVTRRTGCPAFTLGLPPLYALSKLSPALAAAALRMCRVLDDWLQRWTAMSLYICYEFSNSRSGDVSADALG
jgi:ubiquinone/menaquinone biosynthesis C-methylase UbiE